MNANEPVAWMQIHYKDKSVTKYSPVQTWEDDIPLYTHPVKEQDTECQYCKQGCIRCDARKQLTDEEIVDIGTEFLAPKDCDIYTFARAILRKAQEK